MIFKVSYTQEVSGYQQIEAQVEAVDEADAHEKIAFGVFKRYLPKSQDLSINIVDDVKIQAIG